MDASKTGLGIIIKENGNNKEELRLELWRGMSVIENYIACTQKRRQEVARLYRISRSFIQNYPDRISNSISCLLADKPGSGKTALIKGLREQPGHPTSVVQYYSYDQARRRNRMLRSGGLRSGPGERNRGSGVRGRNRC
ncbi:MAG: hypothetical protein MZU91_06960 [Desulfosudis oleivorans]|nr:hypothetical protein [Desulfosudis oleivorans]